MTIVADHPLNGPAFAQVAASEQAFSAAWAKRAVAVSEFVEECRQAGVELLQVPLPHAPRDGVAGSRWFVVKQVEEVGGYTRFHVTAERSLVWGGFPVGSGPHYGSDDDELTAEFAHFNLGEHVFVGILDGYAFLAPNDRVDSTRGEGAGSDCPVFSWCNEDHSDPRTSMTFHMAADKREPAPGVLRADIVCDGDTLTVEVCDNLDWRVPMQEAPQLVAAVRKEADRLEARLHEFAGSGAEARGAAA